MALARNGLGLQGEQDQPESKAHRAIDAALDFAFERGRLTGLRDARDNPADVDQMIEDCSRWL